MLNYNQVCGQAQTKSIAINQPGQGWG